MCFNSITAWAGIEPWTPSEYRFGACGPNDNRSLSFYGFPPEKALPKGRADAGSHFRHHERDQGQPVRARPHRGQRHPEWVSGRYTITQ